jgi:hypothetical protein
MNTNTTPPVSTQGVRADDVRAHDQVWIQDWDGEWVGGPVEAIRPDGEDVQVEVRCDFGLSGRRRVFSTSPGNTVQVAFRY